MLLFTVPLLLLTGVTEVVSRSQDGVILTYSQQDGEVKYFSDGNDVLFTLFSQHGDLVDCDIGKLNGTVQLFREALSDRPKKSEHLLLDVRKLSRQCRRFLRKKLRLSKDENAEIGDIKLRIKYHMGYPGTKWCMTNHPPDNSGVTVEHKDLDKCCQALHKCKDGVIEAAAMYKGLFNYYPWPIYNCSCSQTFRQCINNIQSEEAKEVETIYFDVIGVPCISEEESKQCVAWNRWVTECEKFVTVKTATFGKTPSGK